MFRIVYFQQVGHFAPETEPISRDIRFLYFVAAVVIEGRMLRMVLWMNLMMV
jgi:hypothetical protein